MSARIVPCLSSRAAVLLVAFAHMNRPAPEPTPLKPVLLPTPLAVLAYLQTSEAALKAGGEDTGLLLQMKEHI